MRPIEHAVVLVPALAVFGFIGWSIMSTVIESKSKAAEVEAANDAAREAGFKDTTDRKAALSAGFADAGQWTEAQRATTAKLAADEARMRREWEAKAPERAAQAAKDAIDRERREAEAAELSRDPAERVTLPTLAWSLGGFGSVGLVTVTIDNGNNYPIKDIGIACTFSGKSGTELSTARRIIYDTVKARTKRTFKEFNIGLINHQSARARCEIASAARL